MSIGIAELIAGIFKPAADLVDSLHTSEEERIDAKGRLMAVQASVLDRALNYELESLKARAGIVSAEAQSEGILARNWRPVTMLTFLALIVGKAMGWIEPQEDMERLWGLMELGLGGYVGGRSLEKITSTIVKSKALGKAAE